MEIFHSYLMAREGVWLFYVLAIEGLLSLGTFIYMVKEYYYDKNKDDSRVRKTRKKGMVKVVVDNDGQAVITNQPKGIDVEITQKGEE